MLSALLGFLSNLLASLAKAWFGEQQRTNADEQVGIDKQAKASEDQANAKAQDAIKAHDDVKPLTASELPAHNPTNDPDFRD